MPSFRSSIFELDIRPPTPPEDNSQQQALTDALDFLHVDHPLPTSLGETEVLPGLDTPPRSSPLRTAKITPTREKKVGFREWTEKHNGQSPRKTPTRLRSLPRTKDAKPLKSILKSHVIYVSTPEDERFQSTGYFSHNTPVDAKMLEFVVHALSSTESTARLDGYQTINDALKIYQDSPEETVLRDRVPQLLPSILRDIRLTSEDTRNTNLTTQALKLSIALFQIPSLASVMTNDFRTTLLVTALDVLGSDVLNKAIANHFLYLLGLPEFRPRALDRAKAELLLTRLDDITNRISGNSVVHSRLTIYNRLIEMRPTVMANNIRKWIEHIFHACMSNNDVTCRRAIECGHRAGREFGKIYACKKAVVDIFGQEVSDQGTYGDYFVSKLREMVADRTRRSLAPRIWSMIVLFFQNAQKGTIAEWQMWKPLGLVIQECLKQTEVQTKYQTMLAWNRLVYVAGLEKADLSSRNRLVPMLLLPFSNAFEKIHPSKTSSEARKAVHIGYTTLLYYALQPTQSFTRLDTLWKMYAGSPLALMLRTGDKDEKYAVRALKALFYDGAKTWDAERTVASSEVNIKIEDLPRLDPNWLRSRLSLLLSTFEDYFGASCCIASTGSDIFETPWRHLVSAVAEAGAQEVRASTETKEAIACFLNCLCRIWMSAGRWLAVDGANTFVGHFGRMLICCLEAFGTVAFLEDSMSVDESAHASPAPTPSGRTSKHPTTLQSPFRYCLRMLFQPPEALVNNGTIVELVESLLELVMQGQLSVAQRLALLQQSLADARLSSRDSVASGLSETVLTLTASVLRSDQENRPSNCGQMTKSSVTILTSYLAMQGDNASITGWIDTFNVLADQLSSIGGEPLVHIGLVDHLIDAVLCEPCSVSVSSKLPLATAILSRATWISSRQQLDKAFKLLGTQHLERTKKSDATDKNERLAQLINTHLLTVYSTLDEPTDLAGHFIDAMLDKTGRCPTIVTPILLQTTKTGFSCLLEDFDSKLAGTSEVKHDLRQRLWQLWQCLSAHAKALPVNDESLQLLSPLLISALRSRHAQVVNDAIAFWNASYGQQTDLRYPVELHEVLCEVAKCASVELCYGLPDEHESQANNLPAFAGGAYVDTITDEPAIEASTPAPVVAHLVPHRTPAASSAMGTKTPESKPIALPRLRHDDSQIEFVAIEHLPAELVNEDSQLLTDHQREVRERQQQDASGMLGVFSSSPLPSSTNKNIIVDRVRENKLQEESGGSRSGTPEVVDDQVTEDEALGSSPSAQSAQRAQSRTSRQGSSPPLRLRQPIFRDVDDDVMDIPSSPPEQPEDFVYNPEEVFAGNDQVLGSQGPDLELTLGDLDGTAIAETQLGSDIAAGALEDSVVDPDATTIADMPASLLESPTYAIRRSSRSKRLSGERRASQSSASRPADADTSRVEDSFAGSSQNLASPQQSQTTRSAPNISIIVTPLAKRKRNNSESATKASNAKRQKRSPIKKLFDRFMGRAAAEYNSDDDMEDCIVVATQPEVTNTPGQEVDIAVPASQPELSSVKRRPGRPKVTRLSAASTVNAMEDTALQEPSIGAARSESPEVTRGQKRKSGRLSGASAEEFTSLPRARKTKKTKKSQDTKTAPAAETSQEVPETPITTNTAAAKENSNEELLSPEDQLQREAAEAAKEERLILTPKGLLGRFRDMLTSVKDMGKQFVLGQQDQLEMTTVLLELGREVTLAAQRGQEEP